MGIHNFHKSLDIYKRCKKKAKYFHFDYVYIDINYCLHCIVNKSDKDTIIPNLISYIKMLIKFLIPLRGIILVADGPPPAAKLYLQKERRKNKTATDFSLNFTPGTEFMNKLEDNIKPLIEYIKFYYSIDVTIKFNEIDEGEIKIKKAILSRSNNPNHTHLIISNDADIILLGSCTNNIPIYVYVKNKNEYSIINITELLLEHKEKYDCSNINDFMAINIFLGNDYFPKLAYTNFDKLWTSYKTTVKYNKNGLILSTNPLKIDKSFLMDFLLDIIKNTNRSIKLPYQSDLKIYNDYMYGFLWCYDMYINGACNDYKYYYKHTGLVYPLGLLYEVHNYGENICFNRRN